MRRAEAAGSALAGTSILARYILGTGTAVTISANEIPGGHASVAAMERAGLIRIVGTTRSKMYRVAMLGVPARAPLP